MIYHLEDLREGYDVDVDVVVVGSGAGGAIAAANCAAAGMKTAIVEAGPVVRREDMTRDAPTFMAKYYWEGGLRLIENSSPIPCMQGRGLGGSTVVNSAIMLKLPDWVRRHWIEDDGLTHLEGDAFDRSFERVFTRTSTAKTPMDVQGPRNLLVRDALDSVGMDSGPLPRAVKDCQACADCVLGCENGAKQAMDRTYIPDAVRDGADVYTCSEVEELCMDGTRVSGVRGRVVDIHGWERTAEFHMRAKRVILAAGATHTPCILQHSGINPRRTVGATFEAHLSGGAIAVMDQRVDPWVGATQGWGAISNDIQGMKFESLWADPSIMLAKWGGFGLPFLQKLGDISHTLCLAAVYRGQCSGSVKRRRDGTPRIRLKIPKKEAQQVFRGLQQVTKGLFNVGAKYVHVGMLPTVPEFITNSEQTAGMLSNKLAGHHLTMTGNHVFGSCRMTANPKAGPVNTDGRVRGTEGLWVCDASLFPSPSAVNPQATVMALSDMISRSLADLQH